MSDRLAEDAARPFVETANRRESEHAARRAGGRKTNVWISVFCVPLFLVLAALQFGVNNWVLAIVFLMISLFHGFTAYRYWGNRH